MGKKARIKRERMEAAAQQPSASPRLRSIIIVVTGAVVLAGIIVAIVIAFGSNSGGPAVAAAAPAGDGSSTGSPTSLAVAAQAVGFHRTIEGGVGKMENLPASAARPPLNKELLPVGTTAPDFSLKTATGDLVSLSSYRGKTVLLEFFATWCPHCQAEAPHLIQIFQSLPSTKYAFVGVNADGEDAASVYAYDTYFNIPYPTLLDPSSHPGSFSQPGSAGEVSAAYRVEDFPTFYVIAPDGRISWRSDQEQPDALILQQLKEASGG